MSYHQMGTISAILMIISLQTSGNRWHWDRSTDGCSRDSPIAIANDNCIMRCVLISD